MEARSITIGSGSDVISGYNTFWEFGLRRLMSLAWRIRNDDQVATLTGAGDYGRYMGQIDTDGDLAFFGSHTEGVTVCRIEDNGAITRLMNDDRPHNNYDTYWTQVGIDANRKHFYAASYGTEGISRYDYSSGDGATILASKEWFGIADGIHGNARFGSGAYRQNGFVVVGDWLYHGSGTDQNTVSRWNVDTHVREDIAVLNGTSASHWWWWYDEVTDRVYAQSHSAGEARVVVDASTATPTAFLIDMSSAGTGTSLYTFMCVPDPANRNHIWMGSYYGSWVKIDITDILAGTTDNPVVLDNTRYYASTYGFYISSMSWYGPHPNHEDFIISCAYAALHGSGYGWFDQENAMRVHQSYGNNPYWAHSPNSETNSTDGDVAYPDGRKDVHNNDAPFPGTVVTADGSKYWVKHGYAGFTGTRFQTFSADTDWLLEATGDIVFGDYQLTSQGTITHVQLGHSGQWHVPSTCNLQCDVSPDAGANWESYDWQTDALHEFAHVGNTVQVRYTLSGPGTAAPHFQGHWFPTVSLIQAEEPPAHPTSRIRTEVRGVLL